MLYDPKWEQPAVVDDASKCLLDAADLLDRDGWVQGQLGDQHGRHCVLGAMDRTARNADAYCFAQQRLALVLGTLNYNGRTVVEWNDAPCRRKEDVTAALRAAALSKGKGQ